MEKKISKRKSTARELAIKDIRESSSKCYLFHESKISQFCTNRLGKISINTCFL